MIGLMPANDLAVVILAAGKGTRLKSGLAKVLHRAGGRSLVEHVVAACAPLKRRKTVVVVGYQAEQVSAVVEPLETESVMQQPQRGTGHALHTQLVSSLLADPTLWTVTTREALHEQAETPVAAFAPVAAAD